MSYRVVFVAIQSRDTWQKVPAEAGMQLLKLLQDQPLCCGGDGILQKPSM